MKLTHILKQVLNESMTLYYKGWEHADKRLDNILELSSHLQGFLYQYLEKLPDDQQTYFSKNRPADLLTIDGLDDMDSPTGILNLYVSGYTLETQKQFLRIIVTELRKLKIKYGKFKLEKSNSQAYNVIRIPILENNTVYSGPPEINLSNRNFYHILHNVLQFEPDDDSNSGWTFTVDELKNRIIAVLKHDPEWVDHNQIRHDIPDAEKISPETNPYDKMFSDMFAGAHIIHSNLESDKMFRILQVMLKYCKWCEQHNITDLYVA
jgi:hypothetical protein